MKSRNDFWKNKMCVMLLVLMALTLLISGCRQRLSKGTICYGTECFSVEIVSTPEDRAEGLMHRTELAEDKGMFFVFEKSAVYPFWMKNTLIPLDIIWLDSRMNVLYIAEDVQPCKVDPCPVTDPGVSAIYVLELNAGTAERIGLKVGDSLTPDSSLLAGAEYI